MEQNAVWTPSAEQVKNSYLSQFTQYVNDTYKHSFDSYEELYEWSLDQTAEFWTSLSSFTNVIWQKESSEAFIAPPQGKMLGAKWFPEGRLNFAENLLGGMATKSKVISICEGREDLELNSEDLQKRVAHCAAYLRTCGVSKGDRVAGVLPNTEAAIVAMLATASLGAVWSSCSPDFGEQGIIDRFGQIDPKVIFGVHSYSYNGKVQDCLNVLKQVSGEIKSLQSVCLVNLFDTVEAVPDFGIPTKLFSDFETQEKAPSLTFEAMAFDDPLYIMFSSGTTGVPKCIVHGVGGTLLQHKKELMLHSNLGPGKSLLYFTTCGWMMWNWMVSALSVGSDLLVFEGSPAYPSISRLWSALEQYKVSVFGTSPKFLSATENKDFCPKSELDLSALETILSTGAPLLPEQYDWVAEKVGSHIHLASISGGTDIISCFMLGVPTRPVFRGEIQGAGLGMALECWVDGKHVEDQKGELVCSKAFPSMPIGFWNDDEGKRYRAAYFDFYEHAEVWRHGDFISIGANGGVTVFGRSDATLNPGGVRIGTAEIYRVVENLDGVEDSLAAAFGDSGDVEIALFVILEKGTELTEDMQAKIKKAIRMELTPRHVPAKIFKVKDIPYTRSGKKLELAVTRILHQEDIPNKTAIANVDCLEDYVAIAKSLN